MLCDTRLHHIQLVTDAPHLKDIPNFIKIKIQDLTPFAPLDYLNQALAIYKQAGAKKEIERTKRDIQRLKGK
jgi:hypothetical protein